MRIRRSRAITGAVVLATAASAAAVAAAHDNDTPLNYGTAALSGRAILAADTFRAGSSPSGEFLTAADRATATRNGVTVAATGPAFAEQPIQGISNVIPADEPGTWWALSDNGFGARPNSGDYELAVTKVRPAFSSGVGTPAGGVEVVGGFRLSDPDDHVTWQTSCDRTGTQLPPFDFNALPATVPALCATGDRVLTGFDFDLESMQIAKDGTFWFGEEFGPFLLHTDATGRLLEAPIPTPGVKAPQNPTIDVAAGERPNLAASKGFEGMGISPDRRFLYALLEGAVTGDNPSDLRIYRFDLRKREFNGYQTYRLELPSGLLNTSVLRKADGSLAYPGDLPPVGGGPNAIGELTLLNSGDAVVIERDGGGDFPNVPRFKKIFPIEFAKGWNKGVEHVEKAPALIDLMAVPDPDALGGDGSYFRFPFVTIESVHPVDDDTLVVVNDNNYPFSNGRSASQGGNAGGGLKADSNEFITVDLSGDLDVDARLLKAPKAG